MKQTVKKGVSATSKRSEVVKMKPLTKDQQKLVSEHIPFAMRLGKSYAALGNFVGVPVEDLQQEACFGLCIAAQGWNSSGHTSRAEGKEAGAAATFQTFAYDFCLKYIMLAINKEEVSVISLDDDEAAEIDVMDDDDETAFAVERRRKVEAMLAVLNAQEKKVVRLIYGFGSEVHGFKEVAQKMHIQVARVHQIYEKARTKMEFYKS